MSREPYRQRHQRQGRRGAARRAEDRRPRDVEVAQSVDAAVAVHHAVSRIVTHAGRAHVVMTPTRVGRKDILRLDLDAHRSASVDAASVAEAAWREFAALFPEGPRRPVRFHEGRHGCLDEALAMAHSLLAVWDPRIDFCGVPDEAQYGIALAGAKGETGQLAARTAGCWTLRWDANGDAVREQWDASAWDAEAGVAWACAGTPRGIAPFPRFPFVAADSGVAPRQT